MVPGFSKQHLCNRDLAKIRIPEILGQNPHDSRSLNPYLAEVRGQQRATHPFRPSGKPRPIGVPGMALCQKNLAAMRPAPHKVHAGLPREAR